jgi:hypothetical protein
MEEKKQTVGELLDSEEYKKELGMVIASEQEHYDHMMRDAFVKGMRLQRNPINSLREREVFNVEDMTAAYKLIILKRLDGFSSGEREYIKRVCLAAYWRVLEKRKKAEKEKDT